MAQSEMQEQDPLENLDCNILLNSLVYLEGKNKMIFEEASLDTEDLI